MIRHNGFGSFVEHAFAKASPLCTAQFGPLAAQILADDRARPQGFEHALMPADRRPDTSFALVMGDDPVFRSFVPDPDEVRILTTPEFYAHWRPGLDRGFFVFDRRSARGVLWFPDDTAPPWAIGQPCAPLLPTVLQGTDWCLAHAAAVGRDGRFLLMVGPRRAGKSTATLACMQAGWDYSGDDLVLINPTLKLVAPLYSSARLRQTGVSAFPELADTAFMVSDEQGAARYELRLPAAPTGGEVAAILCLQREGAATVTLRPARPAESVGFMLRESAARAPGYPATTIPKLLAAGRMASAYIVDTGTDPLAIPRGLAGLLGAAI